jgi:hypothetical protein
VRYFFHVIRAFNDDEGAVLSGPDVAMRQAAVIASEFAEDGEWHGHLIYVTDEHGNEIGRVPVVAAAEDDGG